MWFIFRRCPGPCGALKVARLKLSIKILKVGAENYEINAYKQLFQLFLSINYPDLELEGSFARITRRDPMKSQSGMKSELHQLCQRSANKTDNQLIDSYVYTFDFGKKTNIYLTYM